MFTTADSLSLGATNHTRRQNQDCRNRCRYHCDTANQGSWLPQQRCRLMRSLSICWQRHLPDWIITAPQSPGGGCLDDLSWCSNRWEVKGHLKADSRGCICSLYCSGL